MRVDEARRYRESAGVDALLRVPRAQCTERNNAVTGDGYVAHYADSASLTRTTACNGSISSARRNRSRSPSNLRLVSEFPPQSLPNERHAAALFALLRLSAQWRMGEM